MLPTWLSGFSWKRTSSDLEELTPDHTQLAILCGRVNIPWRKASEWKDKLRFPKKQLSAKQHPNFFKNMQTLHSLKYKSTQDMFEGISNNSFNFETRQAEAYDRALDKVDELINVGPSLADKMDECFRKGAFIQALMDDCDQFTHEFTLLLDKDKQKKEKIIEELVEWMREEYQTIEKMIEDNREQRKQHSEEMRQRIQQESEQWKEAIEQYKQAHKQEIGQHLQQVMEQHLQQVMEQQKEAHKQEIGQQMQQVMEQQKEAHKQEIGQQMQQLEQRMLAMFAQLTTQPVLAPAMSAVGAPSLPPAVLASSPIATTGLSQHAFLSARPEAKSAGSESAQPDPASALSSTPSTPTGSK